MSDPGFPEGILQNNGLQVKLQIHEVRLVPSPILYQNQDATITVIDIPCSIEAVQGTISNPWTKRLLSTPPLDHPYPSVEPKSKKALAALPKPCLEELLLEKHVQFALEEVKSQHTGKWCLSRVFAELPDESAEPEPEAHSHSKKKRKVDRPVNDTPEIEDPTQTHHIPPNSTHHLHNIEETPLPLGAPFNLILLDPPWPNRSARRSKHYSTTPDIRSLLSQIPVRERLHNTGIVGIWITNKPAYREMVLGVGGLFEEWGVRMVEEWVWLKVTVDGEPIVPIESTWRKPYELLLVGRRVAEGNEDAVNDEDEVGSRQGNIKRRVIIGVPDLHSRKPNLQALFEPLLGEGYFGLEIFARNLTKGWWAWGNEVLKFQHESCWSDEVYPSESTTHAHNTHT